MTKQSGEAMIINGQQVMPGENKVVTMHIGNLPSNTRIDVEVHVFRSKKPGPVALVMGGLHGDEINGVEIIRNLLARKTFEKLRRGSVIAIPLLNIFGFINFSRDVPDGKDVNRSFPGSKTGSLASRMAYHITNFILPHIDFAIDMHSGGATRYNHPQVRYTASDERAAALAEAFAPPYILPYGTIPKSFRKIAGERKVPIIVFEGGESQRWDGLTIKEGLRGVKRVLRAEKMLMFKIKPGSSVTFHKRSWMRAPIAGLFIWSKRSGEKVSKGTILGRIRDPYGRSEVVIKSRFEGHIIGHNNAAVVSQGDALFHIAYQA